MNTNPALVRDQRWCGMLVHAALDQLWRSSHDAAPDDPDAQGCCPECCAPCVVLYELDEAGLLDEWVGWWPEMLNTSWWVDGAVDREWLARAWVVARAGMLGCHDLVTE